jgi:hypothetical protein
VRVLDSGVDEIQEGLARSNAQWIKSLHLSWTGQRDAVWCAGSCGGFIASRFVVDVCDAAVAHIIKWNDGSGVGLAGDAIRFIVKEVEKPVLLYRASQICTELVSVQSRDRSLIFVPEKSVGFERGVAVELSQRTVQLIGSRLW